MSQMHLDYSTVNCNMLAEGRGGMLDIVYRGLHSRGAVSDCGRGPL